MNEPRRNQGVIHRDAVRMAPHAAMIDCGSGPNAAATGTIAVVPLLDGDRIAGFEIRCSCGTSAVVECVYKNEA
jgi:hypothetical protein